MDYGRGLSFMQRDPNWIVKTVIGSVLMLVPIVNFATYGYMLDVIRNVAQERETPLPEWGENFGDRFVRGFLAIVIQFVYMLPIWLVACLFFALGAAGSGALDDGGALFGSAMLCLMPIFFIALLACTMIAWIGIIRYGITNTFSEAFRFGDIMATLRANLGRWAMLLLMMLVLYTVFGVVASIPCFLGFVFFGFYPQLVLAHWLAQANRGVARSTGGATYGA